MSREIFISLLAITRVTWQTNRRRMNARTAPAGTTSVDQRTQTICGVKFSGFIQMQMALIVFRTEIFFQRELRKQDPKSISWEIVIHGGRPLIQKLAGYIGVKSARMPTTTRERREWEWMNLIRPEDPDILAGPISLARTWPTRCIII